MPQTIDDIKAKARQIWAEIIPSGDASALPDVMHPDCADHSARPGEPQGIEGLTATMDWLHGVFADLAFDIYDDMATMRQLGVLPARPQQGQPQVHAAS